MAIIIYKDPKQKVGNSWIKYFLTRIKQNKNNLIVITGKTGSGKTWSAISVCEMLSKENGVPFGIDNIVFTLRDLMALINSDKLVKGSSMIFDEPQISISSKEFQSEANKVFSYLMSTFRHRNLSLFFCTPYEDLLDLSTRKLFHTKFTTLSINKNESKVILRPVTLDYNSQQKKFYEKFLRVAYKEEEEDEYTTHKLTSWGVPKPSPEMIKLYERKKVDFTSELNQDIQQRLENYHHLQKEKYKIKDERRPLTDKQERVLVALAEHGGNVKQASKDLEMKEALVYFHHAQARKKDYDWKELLSKELPK